MNQGITIKGPLRWYLIRPMTMAAILVIFSIPMYFLDVVAGMWISIVSVIYFGIIFFYYKKTKKELIEQIIGFATNYNSIQNKVMQEMHLELAILSEDGKILWMNDEFKKLTKLNDGFQKTIFSVFPEIQKEKILKMQESFEYLIEREEFQYMAMFRKIYLKDVIKDGSFVSIQDPQKFIIALELLDQTELLQYKTENKNQKLVAAMVYIDNYDEALDSIEDVKKSLLAALVDRRVNNYFLKVDGIIKKIDRDKYFVIFKQQYLEKLKEDRFSILQDVKTIRVGNEIPVTLSMGIGLSGETFGQSNEFARMAIDVALGRGGDQIVVKDGEEIFYFGGNSKQVEKNTRVKARVKAHALREIMESKGHIFIMGHKISDIDAFGAAIGIFCAAKLIGKTAQIVIDEVTSSLRPLKEKFNAENGYSEYMFVSSQRALELANRDMLLVVVDTNRGSYTECPELLKLTKNIVVFDHHRQSAEVIENPMLSYIEPYASSTCEMIAEVLQYFSDNVKLTRAEADCMFAGMLIDTNNFMTKTGVRTFEAAAYLRRCGADVTRVRKLLREDMNAYKTRAEVVRHAKVYRGSFAISICENDKVESPTVVGAQAANELLNIVGIKASFVLTKYQEKIFVSSRSIDEINVQKIMERLGGGGHLNMAGCQMEHVTLSDAMKLIEKTIDGMIEEGEIKL